MQILIIFLGLFTAICRSENSTKQEKLWRIVNGSPLPIEKAPYQTSIEFRSRHGCGGVIIARDLILTAAHCMPKKMRSNPSAAELIHHTPAFYRIRVGHDYTHIGGNVYKVKQWIVHENYNNKPYDYDIALIRLKSLLRYKSTVQPIEIATEEPKPGEMAFITGFGLTEPKMKKEGIDMVWRPLLNITIPVVDREKCNKIIWEIRKIKITENMLCAGYMDERIDDACTGDSGGPLVVNGRLAGLTSWGAGCGRVGLPGMYTNVVNLADWIERAKKILYQIPL